MRVVISSVIFSCRIFGTFWNHFSWSIFFLMLKRDGKWRLAVIYSSPHDETKERDEEKPLEERTKIWHEKPPTQVISLDFLLSIRFHCLHFNIILSSLFASMHTLTVNLKNIISFHWKHEDRCIKVWGWKGHGTTWWKGQEYKIKDFNVFFVFEF